MGHLKKFPVPSCYYLLISFPHRTSPRLHRHARTIQPPGTPAPFRPIRPGNEEFNFNLLTNLKLPTDSIYYERLLAVLCFDH
jgi:hypothetical protein